MNLSPSRTSNRVQHAESLAAAALLADAHAVEGFHIGQGAAVENGQLQVVDLDDHVVDAHADEGGEQVFGRRDEHALAHQAGCVAHLGHVASVGGNLKVVQVSAPENDARTRRRRAADAWSPERPSAVQRPQIPRVLQSSVPGALVEPIYLFGVENPPGVQIRRGVEILSCGIFATLCACPDNGAFWVKSVGTCLKGRRIRKSDSGPVGEDSGKGVRVPRVADSNIPMRALLAGARRKQARLIELTRRLVLAESPSDEKAAVDACVALAAAHARQLGGRVKLHRQRQFGDVLEARFGPRTPVAREDRAKPVLLLGHLDTVWPAGHAQDHAVPAERRPPLGTRNAGYEGRRRHGLHRSRDAGGSGPAAAGDCAPAEQRRGDWQPGFAADHRAVSRVMRGRLCVGAGAGPGL